MHVGEGCPGDWVCKCVCVCVHVVNVLVVNMGDNHKNTRLDGQTQNREIAVNSREIAVKTVNFSHIWL